MLIANVFKLSMSMVAMCAVYVKPCFDVTYIM